MMWDQKQRQPTSRCDGLQICFLACLCLLVYAAQTNCHGVSSCMPYLQQTSFLYTPLVNKSFDQVFVGYCWQGYWRSVDLLFALFIVFLACTAFFVVCAETTDTCVRVCVCVCARACLCMCAYKILVSCIDPDCYEMKLWTPRMTTSGLPFPVRGSLRSSKPILGILAFAYHSW